MDLINPSSKRNPDPAPLMAAAADKSIATCNHCGFRVVWDQAGQAQMEQHYLQRHPDRI